MRGRRRLYHLSRLMMPLGLIVFALSVIVLNVTAATNPFKITNAGITVKTGGVDAVVSGFDETRINTDATFYQLGGSVSYAVTLQNTSEKNQKITSITDDNSNPYLVYSYANHAGEEIAAGGELVLDVTVTYANEIADPSARVQDFGVKFLIEYEEVEQPIEPEEPTIPDTPEEEIVVPNTDGGETIAPNTGVSEADSSRAVANRPFIALAIVGLVLVLLGLKRSKFSTKTKVAALALFGTLAAVSVVNATGGDFAFEFVNNFTLKDKLSITTVINNNETSKIVSYGGILDIDAPEKPGYTFAGWVKEGGEPFNPAEPIFDDAKITAVFNIDTYHISYDLAGGETASENATSYTVNDNITLVEPTKDFYTFIGWTGTGLDAPTKNVVIPAGSTGERNYVANYSPVAYSVAYDNITPEELVLLTNPLSYTIESEPRILNNPVDRTDIDGDTTQTFVGWKEGDTISTTINLPNPNSMGDKVFIAQWVDVAPTTYSIDYELHDGTTETANITEFTKETETFTIINPTKTGYEFSGWSGTGLTGDNTITLQVVKGTRENLSFEAHYTPNTYNVVFNSNGGAGTMGAQVLTYDVATNLNANIFTRTGYHFTGWNTAANGSGSAYGNGAEVKNLRTSGEITLYAQWEANTYEIVFSGNHERAEFAMANLAMTYDKAKTLPANGFRVLGCVFESWNTKADGTGKRIENGASVMNLTTGGTVTLFAQWAVTPYTVVYNKNHADATGTMGTQTIEYAVAFNLLPNGFARAGHSFIGWNTKADASGTHYDDQAMVINLATDGTVNLYAEWQANSYSIAFDKNHSDATGEMSNLEMVYGETANLPSNQFARTGYLFDGWNTKADGTGANYADTASVTNLAVANSDVITLYAKWTPAPYEIVFHGNDTEATGTMANVDAYYDTEVTLPKNQFKKPGYVFTNWNTKADGTGDDIEDEDVVLNLATGGTADLYAEWRIAEAMFKPGLFVNNQIRFLSGAGMHYGASLGNTTPMTNNTGYIPNPKVLAIKQSPVEPDFEHMNTYWRYHEGDDNYDPNWEKVNDWNIVSVANSKDPIYIWYVPNDAANTNGTIYYWSYDITPQLNPSSSRMFEGMSELAEVDFAPFDSTGVENITTMFAGTKIKSVDLSNFDTTKLSSMRQLFKGCSMLTDVNFGSNFDTSRVKDFTGIFHGDVALESVDISMFDTRAATSMASMFNNAKTLRNVTYGENFKTDNVQNFSSMYENTLAMENLDIITTFNTAAATNMNAMFKNSKVSEIDVTGFDTSSVINMGSMFMNMDGLSTLDIHNFDTRKAEDMSYLFSGLKNITAHPIVGANFQTGALKNMKGMYRNYSNNLTTIDLSTYDTTNVTDMSELFYENPQLTSVNINGFVTDKVTTFSHMFDGCSGIRTIPEVATFNTGSATDMSYMFRGMNLDSLDLSGFNTEQVRSIANMFAGTTMGQDLDFSSFNTPALTNVGTAFANFKTPHKLDLHTFNTENVTLFEYMFKGLEAPYLDISNFDLSKSNNHQQMFHGMVTEIMDIGKFESSGKTIEGNYLMSNATVKTVLVSPDYVPNFGDVLDLTKIVGGQGTTYMGYSGIYGRIDHAEDGGEPGYFTDRTKYTIKYHINTDDVNATGTMANQEMVGGTNTALNANQFTRTGYKFGGWNTKADLTGIHYDNEQEVSGYGTLHLYAEWGLTPYTVIFDKNAEDATGTMENLTKAFGEWFNLPANNYVKTHYKFMGWNTKANGTGKHYDNEGLVVNLDVDGEVTLYAEWLESTAIIADNGPNTGFSLNIKSLVGNNGSTPSHANYTVKKIVRSDTEPTDEQKARPRSNVAATNSNFPVYIWFDEPTGTIYWWSEAETVFMAKRADYMFANFRALESVDVEHFDTSLTTSMVGMFNGDEALASIDLSNFDTDGVTDMHQMFSGCAALDTLDVSGFDTDDVTNMSAMFSGLTNVSSLNVTSFNTENVENFSGMFRGMKNLTDLDVSGFNTGKATLMNEMFRDCEKLETINVSGFNTAKVTSFEGMFRGCKAVEELDVSRFVTSSAQNISGMFYGCSRITELDLHNFNTSNVISMNHTFLGLTNVEVLDLSTFDTKNVTGMQYTFSSDVNLKTIYVTDKFVTSAIPKNSASSQLMFYQCGKLVGGLGTKFSGQFINHARAHIDGGPDNPGYFTDKSRIIITYHKNDDKATGEMPVQDQAAGTITLNTNQFFRGEGYSFGGWNTEPDGSGEHYDNGQTIVDAFGSLNLYAEWGITPYTIIFDGNGAGVTGTTESMSVNYGERVNLNQSGFAREHYVQTGWNTKVDGTGRHFNDGESVINVINDGEITLYAEWVESIAKFDIGKNVNAAIKRLSNAGSESSHPNRVVKHIVRASSMPNLDSNRIRTISSTDSNLPIYAWYDDSSDSTAYWYTLAEKVSLNEDSSDLFRGFYGLREFDYTQFEETAFTNVSYMFASCEKLESISLGNMDTSRVEDMSNMFFGTKSLEVIDLSMLNTANVKDMNNMFHDTGARVIDISSFDTSKVENMTEMFRGHEETGATQNLVTIYASDKFVTTNVTKSTFMFRRQSAIVGGAGTTWSGHGDSVQFAHIDGGVDNPGYFTDIADKP